MQCKHIKPGSIPCGSKAMKDSDYCYFHNNKISLAEKQAARDKSRKNYPVNLSTPLCLQVEIKDAKDVSLFIKNLIDDVLRNRLDSKTASGVTYMANSLLKAYEVASLEKRIEILENRLD